jgi:putative ABC transport system permease protein
LGGVLMAFYSPRNERRREVAILRAVGVGPAKIILLLVLESGLLALVGSLLGIGLVYALVFLLQPIVEQQFGLFIPIRFLGAAEPLYVAVVVIAGLLVGLIPAWKAYRNALSDGLSVRV